MRVRWDLVCAGVVAAWVCGAALAQEPTVVYHGTQAPMGLTSMGNRAVFVTSDGVTARIWAVDATMNQPVQLTQIARPRPPSAAGYAVIVTNIGLVNGKCLFGVIQEANLTEPRRVSIWSTDGTPEHTAMVAEVGRWTISMDDRDRSYARSSSNGRFALFTVEDLPYPLYLLWCTDGTAEGTFAVHDATAPTAGQVQYPVGYAPAGGAMYFVASDPQPRRLWFTDGTPSGTRPVVVPPKTVRILGRSWEVRGRVLGETGYQDGLATFESATGQWGYVQLRTRANELATLRSGVATSVGLVFSLINSASAELWVTDGSVGGTHFLSPLQLGAETSPPSDFVDADGEVYFSVDDGFSGRELWRTDGTQAGTIRVSDIVPGAGSSSPTRITRIGYRRVAFIANTAANTYGLFEASADEPGPRLLAHVGAPASPNDPAPLAVLGPTILYSGRAPDGSWAVLAWRPRCVCDRNYDGVVTLQDLFVYLDDFTAGIGDINQDGVTGVEDFFEFLGCWFGACG